jgi:RNA recognition motif-containing protein
LPDDSDVSPLHSPTGSSSSLSSCAFTQLCQLFQNSKDEFNYEEAIRKFENTEAALKEKAILRKTSLKGAKIDVRLFVGQVPKTWDDQMTLKYFQRFGTIIEAKIIREKIVYNSGG